VDELDTKEVVGTPTHSAVYVITAHLRLEEAGLFTRK